MRIGLRFVLALAIAVSALLPSSALGATITVTSNGDTGPGTLRDAIGGSSPGDTINFSSSLSGQTITLTSGELAINHSLTVSGLGQNSLTVSGDANSRIFDIDAPSGTVNVSGLTVTDGKAPSTGNEDGGGILVQAGAMNLSNATVDTNKTTGTGSTTRTCSGFCGTGGGISADSTSTTTLTNVTVDDNVVDPTEPCGGVASENAGALVISNSTVDGNRSGYGGGVCTEAGADLTISASTIENNTAQGAVITSNAIIAEGGGVDEDGGGTTTITNSTISGNTDYGLGGGVAEDGGGTVNITGSTLNGNTANPVSGGTCTGGTFNPCGPGSNGSGGAIAEDGGGKVNVNASSLDENTASLQGTVHLFNGKESITNTTIYNNTAGSDSGVFTGDGSSSATTTLNSDTIDANPGGDNIHACCGTHINVHNTLLAKGTPGNCTSGSGTIVSQGHNLADDSSCALTGPGDTQGVAPKLGPPQGAPEFLPELPGGPTIDAGDTKANCPTTDERGLPRPDAGEAVCDVGAYEFQDPPPPTTKGPSCALKPQGKRVFATGLASAGKKHKKKQPKGVLTLEANCNQPASLTLTGKITAVLKKKKLGSAKAAKHKRSKAKTFQVRAVSTSILASKPLTLTVKLPKAALAALKKGARESVIFTLTATNSNGAGHTSAAIKRLKLAKVKRKKH